MWFKKIFAAFTKKERLAFVLAGAGALISFAAVMGIVIDQATKAVPAEGGTYIEGVVGQPEYVNPVLAASETDLNLVRLVYNNLYDLSDSITASPDLRTWTVHLKDGLMWQDNQKLTADDVAFTVQSIQNKDANSPLYASWQGVQANRTSELEVQFTLDAPYAFFGNSLKNLYILPKHLFADAPPGNWRLSDYNLKPVGSGSYQFLSYDKGADGFITSYSLAAWSPTNGPRPLIGTLGFKFFNDENDLVQSFNKGQVSGFGGVSSEDISAIARPYQLSSWRTSGYYAIFFNQSKNLALQDAAVRQALSAAIDRDDLISHAFAPNGAVPDYGPIPPDAPYYAAPAGSSAQGGSPAAMSSSSAAAYASSLLDSAGWTISSSTGFRAKTVNGSVIPLSINLTVPQIDFLAGTADYLRNAWQAIGAQVNETMDSPSNIIASAIKNRDYEALLFGNALGPSSDLYSFWDSSQRFYPGLNLAIYGSSAADSLIESARVSTDSSMAAAKLATAQQNIENSYPAVFLYSPNYLLVTDKSIRGIATSTLLIDPSDRFLSAGGWYVNTARVLR